MSATSLGRRRSKPKMHRSIYQPRSRSWPLKPVPQPSLSSYFYTMCGLTDGSAGRLGLSSKANRICGMAGLIKRMDPFGMCIKLALSSHPGMEGYSSIGRFQNSQCARPCPNWKPFDSQKSCQLRLRGDLRPAGRRPKEADCLSFQTSAAKPLSDWRVAFPS